VTVGEPSQLVHLTGLPVEMHGQDRGCPRADCARHSARVEQSGTGVHICIHRLGAGVDHRQCGGDERVRRHDHLVAGANPSCSEHDRQCGGARGDADAVVDPTVSSELALEQLDLAAEDEVTRTKHAPKRGVQVAGKQPVLSIKRAERHLRHATLILVFRARFWRTAQRG
jgi:hypothetical protein